MVNITDLSADVIYCILRYIRKRKDRFAILMTCSYINKICLNRVLTPYIEGGKGMKHAIRNGHVDYYKKWNDISGNKWFPHQANKAIIECIKNGHCHMIQMLLSENGNKAIDITFNNFEMLKEAIKYAVHSYICSGHTDTSILRRLLDEIKQKKHYVDIIDMIIKYAFCNMDVIKCLFEFMKDLNLTTKTAKYSTTGSFVCWDKYTEIRRPHISYIFKVICNSGRDDILESFSFPKYIRDLDKTKGLDIASKKNYVSIIKIILSWSIELRYMSKETEFYNYAIIHSLEQENFETFTLLLQNPKYKPDMNCLIYKDPKLFEHKTKFLRYFEVLCVERRIETTYNFKKI